MSRRRRKASRALVVSLGLLAVVGALVLVKVLQISSVIAMGKEMEAAGPPPEFVASAVAQTQEWERALAAVGTIAGVRSVEIASESPGRVQRIRFESGAVVPEGRVLVELDTSVERAELATAIARRELARVNVERSRALVAEQVAPQAQLDNDEGALETAIAEVAAIEAAIQRKIVRAPFGGRLGIRAVDVGQYLNPGTTLTTLEQIGAVFVDFTLPQERFGTLKVGMPVEVSMQGTTEKVGDGVLAAVDPTIDEATRSIRLRATIPNTKDALRPGMFVDVAVVLPKAEPVVIVPATAIVHAPYGDSVFVIESKKPGSPGMAETPDGKPVKVVRQQFVRLGEARGDFVVVEEGVEAEQVVVTSGAFKLRNGAPIVIDNTVKPDPKLNPTPENR